MPFRPSGRIRLRWKSAKFCLFLPLPLVPLQGESLQGEPLSTFVERGIGGEVSKNVTFINSLHLFLLPRILSSKLEKIQLFRIIVDNFCSLFCYNIPDKIVFNIDFQCFIFFLTSLIFHFSIKVFQHIIRIGI